MHATCQLFLIRVGALEQPKSVLELGSCDRNGQVKKLFPTAERFVGIDIVDGPGVDIVADAATWRSEERFDLVVASSLFEHTEAWPAIVKTAFVHCAGSVAFTTMMAPFPPHSADGSVLLEGEYYRDVTDVELRSVMRTVGFIDITCVRSEDGDVWAVGRVP